MRIIKPFMLAAGLLQGCTLGPEPTVNAPSFDQRCSLPGVVKCIDFDDPEAVEPFVYPPWGLEEKRATVDFSQMASGAGSLRFEIPSNTAADTSGSYWQDFSKDSGVLFSEGDEFYVQWRQRFSTELLKTYYDGGNGWKQIIIGQGDRPGKIAYSCTHIEIVVHNNYQRGYPQMYHSCGVKDGMSEPIGRVSPIKYRADEWMTFQVHVKVGTWYTNDRNYERDSTIELWVAREGYQSQLALSRKNYDLFSRDPTAGYGKVWLLPYHSGKSHKERHPVAYTWYDDLIISTNRIPDP
jgi:hypothetical protein